MSNGDEKQSCSVKTMRADAVLYALLLPNPEENDDEHKNSNMNNEADIHEPTKSNLKVSHASLKQYSTKQGHVAVAPKDHKKVKECLRVNQA